MKTLLHTAIVAAFALAGSAGAQSTADHTAHHPPAAPQATQAALTDGEIRKVDKEAKKLTIKHGPISNLEMPAMTMVFQVKDPGMLDQVKAGDKVRFRAERDGGAYIVTRIDRP